MANYLESLERIADLFQKGVLTKEEFEAEKAYLLAMHRSPTSGDEAGSKTVEISKKTKVAIGVGIAAIAGVAIAFGVSRDMARGSPVSQEVPEAMEAGVTRTSPALIGFSSPKSCEPSDAFSSLLDRIREAAASDDAIQKLVYLEAGDRSVEVRSTKTNDYRQMKVAAVRYDGSWKGLRVSEVRTLDWNKGRGFQLIFRQPVEAVAQILATLGIDLEVDRVNSADGRAAVLESLDSGSAWTCLWATQVASDRDEEASAADD